MKIRTFAMAFALLLPVFARPSHEAIAEGAGLRLEAKIPLGNVAGRVDHMAIDLKRGRLFVAELGNNSVSIVDLERRKVVHRITGLKEPQGLAYAPSTDIIYVANRGDGSVRFFRGTDYAPVGTVNLYSDADNIRIDHAANRVIVGYGDGGLAVIDLNNNSRLATISLGAHPESFQLDPATMDVFVNLPDRLSIAVVDRVTGRESKRWSMPYGQNFAMALDNERQLVLAVFRQPAKLAGFSKQTGTVANEASVCDDVDDVFFDAKRQRIYMSCGAGFIDVRNAAEPGYPQIEQITTVSGARTSLFVPEMDRLLLAARAQPGRPAAIWVYTVAAGNAGNK